MSCETQENINFCLEFGEFVGILRSMKNWSTDAKKLKKNKDKFTVWKLEQLINFGLGKKRLSIDELKKYWGVLDIDPHKRKFLSLLLN